MTSEETTTSHPYPVEGLEDVGGSEVELVQDDPVAPPHGLH